MPATSSAVRRPVDRDRPESDLQSLADCLLRRSRALQPGDAP
jgi:hypothetical protein